MKLSKQTALEIRAAVKCKDVRALSLLYKEEGLSFTRFIWDAYYSIGQVKIKDILLANNDLEEVGGYVQGVTDAHINTILKIAFKDCKF